MNPSKKVSRYRDAFDRDTAYWNEFYDRELAIQEPSLFAKDLLPQLQPGKMLVDMGCGNGRDSLFFAAHGLRVLGVDASDIAVKMLRSREKAGQLEFRCADFVTIDLPDASIDYCYCRFALHAVNEEQAYAMLKNVYRFLKPGGRMFIEARSVYDALNGKGEQIGRNAYIHDGHYRRFLLPDEIKEDLVQQNFIVISCEVSDAFAPYQEEKPPVLRVVAQKAERGEKA